MALRRGRGAGGSAPLALLAVATAAGWAAAPALRGRFWSTAARLPAPGVRERWPGVVAVVPARDEAAMLPETLPGLLGQDYPGAFGVVVVDDHSTDGTGAVAAEAAAGDHAGRLRVVAAADRPPGWAGKVWALRQGLDALGDVPTVPTVPGTPGTGTDVRYVLFTDADIAHPPDSVRRLVTAAEDGSLDLVSLMALLRCETGWERLVVPAFVYFFAQLYPFAWVNDPARRTAAAAGGCVLVRTDALAATDRLERMRGALIDDVSLAALVKRSGRGPGGGRIWLGHTREVVSRRPYPRLADLWDMVARSAYTQLRYSPVLLVLTAGGLVVGYAVPPAAAVAGAVGWARRRDARSALTGLAGLAGYAAMTATYLPTVRHYRLPARWAAALPAAAALYLAMTVDSAVRHHTGRGGAWKGRTYPGGAG